MYVLSVPILCIMYILYVFSASRYMLQLGTINCTYYKLISDFV